MILSKIKELTAKTAKVTGYPEDQVNHVITFVFNYLSNYLNYPTKAGIRLPYLGVIRTSTFRLRHYMMKFLIPEYKANNIPVERFRAYWKLKGTVYKDEQRRDFKTRFNYKFNPSWRQDTDSTQ